MTFSKLSLRNAKRQARDYMVYFVTIVMSAALIYAFNGLVFSQEIRNLTQIMDNLPLVVFLTSIVVVCIIGWLVSYTTNFMLRKRSRELGTYILVGLENGQVARLFFLENLIVGGIALFLGILAGNLIFQALRAVTLSMFHVSYTFRFAFSPKAVLLSLFYFVLIYLLALLKSRRSIKRLKICDLLYLDRQNEEEVIHKDLARRRIFAISIVLGIAGTALILIHNLMTGIIGAVLIIAFLYGFFISFSSGVPAYFNKRPGKKYSGRVLLVFRTLTAKLASMGVVMATISLLFVGTLIAEGSGIIFNVLFESRSQQTTCFDLFIGSPDQKDGSLNRYHTYIKEHIAVRESYSYAVYEADNGQLTDYVQENIERYYRGYDFDILMKESDYTALRAMLGYAPAELSEGQYIIHCMPYLKTLMKSYEKPVELGDSTLFPGDVFTESFTQSLWDGNGVGFILIVPDDLLENQPVSHNIYAAMTLEPVIGDSYEGLYLLCGERADAGNEYDTIFSKASIEMENAASCAMIVFPLYYLALVFTMAAATILTIQLLSETERYRSQYRLLSELGMDRREMGKSLRDQFIIYYAMPVLPPVLIGTLFITSLCNALDAGVLNGPGQIAAIVAKVLCLFFTIYLVYILTAYISLKRSVIPEQ